MVQNRDINVNWLQFNVPTLISVVATAIAVVLWINTKNDEQNLEIQNLKIRLAEADSYREQRSKATDTNFARIDSRMTELVVQVSPLQNVPFRMNSVEASLAETNKRLDRVSETFVNAVEVIRKDISTLSADVKVLGNKTDNLSTKVDELRSKPLTAKPTGFRVN